MNRDELIERCFLIRLEHAINSPNADESHAAIMRAAIADACACEAAIIEHVRAEREAHYAAADAEKAAKP